MNNENQNIEYKRIWQDDNLKSICAFANAQGGVMYIGIDDDGQVLGLDNVHKWQEDIPNKIVQNLGIVWRFMVRNNAFFRAGFIESWGRGIEKIRNAVNTKGMSAPVIQTEMGGLSVRFFRAGLPQSSDGNGTSGTSGTTSHPYNLTCSGGNSLKNNGNNLTTLQADNLTSLKSQITDFCAQWRTLSEIAEHVQRSRQYLRGEVIPQMLDVLERKYDSPTHPKQQYRTKR